MIIYLFILSSAVQIYEFSYIHFQNKFILKFFVAILFTTYHFRNH